MQASLPNARRHGAYGAIGDELYYFGGADSSGDFQANGFEYDIQSNDWSTGLSDMPTARTRCNAVVAVGKLWVVGGEDTDRDFNGEVESYAPETGEWEQHNPQPTPTIDTGVVYDGEFIWAFGGRSDADATEDVVQRYDIASDSWSTDFATMPTGRRQAQAIHDDGKIYVIGGESDAAKDEDAVEIYDIEADSWGTGAEMPTGRHAFAAGRIDGTIICAGGDVGATNTVTTTEGYDIAADSWTTDLPEMPTSRDSMGGGDAVFEGELFVVGGRDDGANALDDNESFTQ